MLIEVKTWTRRMPAVPRILNYAGLLEGNRSLRINLFHLDGHDTADVEASLRPLQHPTRVLLSPPQMCLHVGGS